MTTIQQLRELEKAGPEAEHVVAYERALRNAAPHLFAVVEAAEKVQHAIRLCPDCHELKEREDLDAALADFRNAK